MFQDKIEKNIDLKAPIARVWRALTDHIEFGEWFKAALESPFEVDKITQGFITHPGYEHMKWVARVRVMDNEKLFSFTWCPLSDDKNEGGLVAVSEMETLVEFALQATEQGTHLSIVESGFASLPDDERREHAFVRNSEGWAGQVQNITDHVES